MRRLILSFLFAGCLITTDAMAGGPVTFDYVGKHLIHLKGTGTLPGVTHLTFTLMGPVPAKGQCINNETVVEVSDGANTLSGLLTQGWVYEGGQESQVCKDRNTGALSEFLSIDLFSPSGAESVLWQSVDPDNGATAPDIDIYGFSSGAEIRYDAAESGHFYISK